MWRFKKQIIKRVMDDITMLYDTDSGETYGVRGALQKFIYENNEFEVTDAVEFLVKNYDVERTTASKDVKELLLDFKENDIIESI